MANWIEYRSTRGDIVRINMDGAVAVRTNERGVTQIYLSGLQEPFYVRESPAEVMEMSQHPGAKEKHHHLAAKKTDKAA